MPTPEEFLCTGESNLGWAFGCSRTGASHIRQGRPCEDAFALWSGSTGAAPCIAVAIADGHGDPRHDQSRTGSALAVCSAIEEMVSFHRMHFCEVPCPSIRAEFKADFPRRISRRWQEAVNGDAIRRDIPPNGPFNLNNGLRIWLLPFLHGTSLQPRDCPGQVARTQHRFLSGR